MSSKSSGASGGRTTRLATAGRGGSVDTTEYGAGSQAVEQQPFWDIEVYIPNQTGGGVSTEARGITGDMYPENPWDLITLAGNPLPGIWKAAATPSIQLDVQKPNGFDGAALVSRGYINGGITLTGRLWTPEQWAQWQRVLPLIWRRPNSFAVNDVKKQTGQIQGQQKALEVRHPGLNSMGITSIVLKSIAPPEETGEKGVRQIKLTAMEYVTQPQRQQKADKKTAGVSRDRTVQAQAIEQERAAKRAKAAASAGQKPRPLPIRANAPRPPSVGQSAARLKKLPAAVAP